MVRSMIDEVDGKQPKKLSLVEKIDKINGFIDLKKIEEEHKNRFKLPWNKKLSKGNVLKNYILVFLLKSNLQVVIKKVQITDNMIFLKETGTYHSVRADDIFIYDGKIPSIILPEWSLQPVSAEFLQQKVMDSKSWSFPQKVIIQAMKKSEEKKTGLGGNFLIWAILGIAGLYLLSQLLGGK